MSGALYLNSVSGRHTLDPTLLTLAPKIPPCADGKDTVLGRTGEWVAKNSSQGVEELMGSGPHESWGFKPESPSLVSHGDSFTKL